MNTQPRNSNVPGILLLALFVLALLAACSGAVDVAINGPNLPPGSLPPFPNSENVTTQGTITGFGDLTINGSRFDADNATIQIDSQPGLLSDLKLGHVITLSGRISTAGFTGQASMVRMHSRVIGPVESVDAGNARLTVLGQLVRLAADTQFPVNINPATLDGLAIGDRVRISGYADAAGAIRATRVETSATNGLLQLVGEVSGLDAGNLMFRIGQLTIDYRNVAYIDLPGGAPGNGMTVTVLGTQSNGVLVAEQLLAGPSLGAVGGQRVQLGGIVTRFVSLADFDVNDTFVAASAATTFSNGGSSDLQLNAELVIDGVFTAGGGLRANRIGFGRIAGPTSTLTYALDGFTNISVPTVFNISVTQGTEFSVEVEIDSEAANRVSVSKSGTTLTVALQTGNGMIETIEARVTMPVLDQIDLTGVVNARLQGFDQPAMTINVGNVSNLRGDGLHIGNLQARVSGVSRLDLGDTRPLGAASIEVSGVSQATLNMGVGSALRGSVSTGQGTGSSALFYYGSNIALDVVTGHNAALIWLGETRP